MHIHLKTLGCRLNEAELESWAQGFQQAGHTIVRDSQQADLIVLNSCAVTQEAVRKSRQMIRRIHRDRPEAKLIVSGCYATLNESEAAQLLGVDLIVSNRDKQQLVDKVLTELNLDSMPQMATEPGEVALFNRGRQRAFVKVQDGCRYRCTFCIVTVARGEEKSRTPADIIAEINHLHSQGIQEVILTGVHLGGFGSDIDSHLTHLIKAILSDTDIPRLRLGSLEPWELPEDFFQLFNNPRLLPHLHLPLQSGADSVLRRMARRCKTTEFRQMVEQARQEIPFFNITTDIIVGFPGETDQEWQQSLEFIEQMAFGHIHIFTYSPRQGTKAATLPDPVPNHLKKQRSRQLHHVAAQMKQAFIQRNLEQRWPVLWEGYSEVLENGRHRVFGYTPNYLRVACDVKDAKSIENRIIPATLQQPQHDFVLTTLGNCLV